jgi:hypothetical protein
MVNEALTGPLAGRQVQRHALVRFWQALTQVKSAELRTCKRCR